MITLSKLVGKLKMKKFALAFQRKYFLNSVKINKISSSWFHSERETEQLLCIMHDLDATWL